MFKTVQFPIVGPLDRTRRPRLLTAAFAVGLALAASGALAGSDYPPGLFENSPVVGPGGAPGPAAGQPSVPAGQSEMWQPPVAEAPPEPYDGGEPPPAPMAPPAGAYAPPDGYAPQGGYAPPGAYPPAAAYAAPSYDYCAGIASRTFATLEEVRRAHARCDRAGYAPPPGYRAPGY